MSKSAFEISYDAKNVVVELGPTKPPTRDDKDAPTLKRLAPKAPKKRSKRLRPED